MLDERIKAIKNQIAALELELINSPIEEQQNIKEQINKLKIRLSGLKNQNKPRPIGKMKI